LVNPGLKSVEVQRHKILGKAGGMESAAACVECGSGEVRGRRDDELLTG
jgi:hypothetical protein